MKYILILLMSCVVITANGQNKKNKGYQFKDTKLIKTTPIEVRTDLELAGVMLQVDGWSAR